MTPLRLPTRSRNSVQNLGMKPTPPAATVVPLRPDDHEDAARVAIDWLAERHRKGWRNAFEAVLALWRPNAPASAWQLNDDGMTMVSINVGEPSLTPCQQRWIAQLGEKLEFKADASADHCHKATCKAQSKVSSGVAQWQSTRLVTERALVQAQPPDPSKP
jgi:hypothetical protein